MIKAAHFLPLLLDGTPICAWTHLQDSRSFGLRLVEGRKLHGKWYAEAKVAICLQVFRDFESLSTDGRRNKVQAMGFLEQVKPFGIVGGCLVPAIIRAVEHLSRVCL